MKCVPGVGNKCHVENYYLGQADCSRPDCDQPARFEAFWPSGKTYRSAVYCRDHARRFADKKGISLPKGFNC